MALCFTFRPAVACLKCVQLVKSHSSEYPEIARTLPWSLFPSNSVVSTAEGHPLNSSHWANANDIGHFSVTFVSTRGLQRKCEAFRVLKHKGSWCIGSMLKAHCPLKNYSSHSLNPLKNISHWKNCNPNPKPEQSGLYTVFSDQVAPKPEIHMHIFSVTSLPSCSRMWQSKSSPNCSLRVRGWYLLFALLFYLRLVNTTGACALHGNQLGRLLSPVCLD